MTSALDPNVEYVVLCGADYERVGYAPKSEVHHKDTPLHLAFSCYVFDPEGALLVTWRATTKKTWPGVRTNSCCGHPGPGEVLPDAVARRLTDELGVVVDTIDLVLPAFAYQATMADGVRENEVCPVYRATVGTRPELRPDPAEVDDAAWVPWREFATEVRRAPDAVSPWCARQVDELATLGPDPLRWPVSDDTELPLAAREPLVPRG
ncbi:isopentenyl-diphosphate Delta-isomerase [Saccharomonospora saliphila]|uniref:isopentenyl-diphosphate Delta-isomerase n=1 Tax=Saccharomonospora saliphila TaxID=369829 RepID=UPI00035C61B5|nr:isopentenyl-diphosphate Delta-isomerase [Saccharomonospora saliphila]